MISTVEGILERSITALEQDQGVRKVCCAHGMTRFICKIGIDLLYMISVAVTLSNKKRYI